MKCLIVLSIMLIFTALLAGCSNVYRVEYDSAYSTDFKETTEETMIAGIITKESIYEGHLPEYDETGLVYIDVNNHGNIWIVNGNKYKQLEDEYLLLSMQSHWKFNLNEFSPFGITENSTVLFAPKYNSNAGVLVAKKDENCILLVESDTILNSTQYDISDFNYDLSLLGIDNSLLMSLWDIHINTREDTVATILDGIPSIITLTLKDNPALIYEFDYIQYKGEYYTSAPNKTADTPCLDN